MDFLPPLLFFVCVAFMLRTSLYQVKALPEMRLGIEGAFLDGQIETPERHVSVHDWEFPGLELQLKRRH
jgi:hypothetical protein